PPSESKSMPSAERPNAIAGCVTAADLAWGIAIASPTPVVLCASRAKISCLNTSLSFNLPARSSCSIISDKTASFASACKSRMIISFCSKSVIFILLTPLLWKHVPVLPALIMQHLFVHINQGEKLLRFRLLHHSEKLRLHPCFLHRKR